LPKVQIERSVGGQHLSVLGFPWGVLGFPWSSLEASLGRLEALLGLSCGILGSVCGSLGASLWSLGRLGVVLGSTWGQKRSNERAQNENVSKNMCVCVFYDRPWA
jgi:hypothetical protein